MTDTRSGALRLPLWLLIVAGFGVAWNIFGLVQLTDFVLQTKASLTMKGMTPTAADVYYGLPLWMKLAFALGSFGGLFGSVALIVRKHVAVSIFVASLAGYKALYAGDYAYGVFDVIPGQLAILSVVVAIAAALFVAGVAALRQNLLR